MSLFVVVHRHDADRCPARDRASAAMLLQHLAPANASTYEVTLHGEAVVNGAHTLHLILDAPSEAHVQRFMAPFAQTGSVEVLPASPCEAVVTRGGC